VRKKVIRGRMSPAERKGIQYTPGRGGRGVERPFSSLKKKGGGKSQGGTVKDASSSIVLTHAGLSYTQQKPTKRKMTIEARKLLQRKDRNTISGKRKAPFHESRSTTKKGRKREIVVREPPKKKKKEGEKILPYWKGEFQGRVFRRLVKI